MAVTEQNRSPAAHEIDVFAPVDVAHTTSFGGSEKLRIAVRQPRRVEMTPHPAGNDPMGASPQHRVGRLRFAKHRRLFGHGRPLVDFANPSDRMAALVPERARNSIKPLRQTTTLYMEHAVYEPGGEVRLSPVALAFLIPAGYSFHYTWR
jgi:hypothetical protein